VPREAICDFCEVRCLFDGLFRGFVSILGFVDASECLGCGRVYALKFLISGFIFWLFPCRPLLLSSCPFSMLCQPANPLLMGCGSLTLSSRPTFPAPFPLLLHSFPPFALGPFSCNRPHFLLDPLCCPFPLGSLAPTTLVLLCPKETKTHMYQ
jgi:hypothetical protein